jgi:hypothetical protein
LVGVGGGLGRSRRLSQRCGYLEPMYRHFRTWFRHCFAYNSQMALPNDRARFWQSVDRRGPTECWPWQGCTSGGYGWFRFGKIRRAHVASWVFHNGPITDGRFVLHRCDNPPCVNPAHLFLGTHRENMDDALRKGRLTGGLIELRPSLPSPWKIAANGEWHRVARPGEIELDF